MTLYIINAATKTTKAADPATVNLFKAALFSEGDGASDGEEIADGVTAGVAAGVTAGVRGGDGGELTAEGDGEGAFFTGTEGETAGDGNGD